MKYIKLHHIIIDFEDVQRVYIFKEDSDDEERFLLRFISVGEPIDFAMKDEEAAFQALEEIVDELIRKDNELVKLGHHMKG